MANNEGLTARDVREVTGLSYRRLNDWEARGALPASPRVDQGWRRFSTDDVFVLQVTAALRDHLGVPVERLKALQDTMAEVRPGIVAATESILAKGDDAWLVTDLVNFVRLDERPLVDCTAESDNGTQTPVICLRLGPLVRHLRATITTAGQTRLEAKEGAHQ